MDKEICLDRSDHGKERRVGRLYRKGRGYCALRGTEKLFSRQQFEERSAVAAVGNDGGSDELRALCGKGFRDMTRIAAGSPEMWGDIVSSNREHIRGELVGINTAIFSESGGYQGVGFAVPSNLAKRVMEELIEFGEVRRGSFGYVDVRQMSPRLARELGAPDTRGLVVWQIHQDSAAARVGIEPGDVIVAFNGQPVNDPAAYVRLLSDAPIGSTVTLEIIRAGEQRSFEVPVLQARPR